MKTFWRLGLRCLIPWPSFISAWLIIRCNEYCNIPFLLGYTRTSSKMRHGMSLRKRILGSVVGFSFGVDNVEGLCSQLQVSSDCFSKKYSKSPSEMIETFQDTADSLKMLIFCVGLASKWIWTMRQEIIDRNKFANGMFVFGTWSTASWWSGDSTSDAAGLVFFSFFIVLFFVNNYDGTLIHCLCYTSSLLFHYSALLLYMSIYITDYCPNTAVTMCESETKLVWTAVKFQLWSPFLITYKKYLSNNLTIHSLLKLQVSQNLNCSPIVLLMLCFLIDVHHCFFVTKNLQNLYTS